MQKARRTTGARRSKQDTTRLAQASNVNNPKAQVVRQSVPTASVTLAPPANNRGANSVLERHQHAKQRRKGQRNDESTATQALSDAQDYVVAPIAPGAVAVEDGQEQQLNKAPLPILSHGEAEPPELRVHVQQQQVVPDQEDPISSKEDILEGMTSDSLGGTLPPQPQENKPDPGTTKKSQSRKIPTYAWVILILIVAAIAIGCGVGLTRGRSQNSIQERDPIDIVSTQFPSFAPSFSPTVGIDAVMDLLKSNSLDPERLDNTSSAEFQAALWLANDPNMESYDQNRMIQRYAMATIFYRLDGFQWFRKENWLSYDVHECNWQQDQSLNFQGIDNPCFGNAVGTIGKLALVRNNLKGSLPLDLALLSSLQILVIRDDGEVTGTIPSELGLLSSLVSMELDSLQLTGTIPKAIISLSQLRALQMDSNNLVGPIPSEIGQLTSLEVLLVTSNELNSTLPTDLGKLTALRWFSALSNRFSGTIPTELGLLTSLEILDCGILGTLTGSFPTQIWALTNLNILSIQSNSLQGEIPPEVGNLTALVHFVLPANRFAGELPSELGLLSMLTRLDVSENRFIGTIPTELGMLSQLESLILQGNRFDGTLPSEVEALRTAGRLRMLTVRV